MENVNVEGPLTVEHILPQQWVEHWPLPDGTTGFTFSELFDVGENDPRAFATRRRNEVLQTLGNLTILPRDWIVPFRTVIGKTKNRSC